MGEKIRIRFSASLQPPGRITLSESDDTRTLPKSLRHERIIDVAAEQPDVSLADIAAEIPSATLDLVEHVREEYGDPELLHEVVQGCTASGAITEEEELRILEVHLPTSAAEA